MRSATTLLACAGLALLSWGGTVQGAGPAPPAPSLNPSPFYSGNCGQMVGNPACDPPYLRQWESYRDVPFHLEQHVREAKKRDQEYAKKEGGAKCTVCHGKMEGKEAMAKNLNETGKCYAANDHSLAKCKTEKK